MSDIVTTEQRVYIGTLMIRVNHAGMKWDHDFLAYRERYTVHIQDDEGHVSTEDVYSGVGAVTDTRAAMASTLTFLSAAVESYDYAQRRGLALSETENGELFPEWVLIIASEFDASLQVEAFTWGGDL